MTPHAVIRSFGYLHRSLVPPTATFTVDVRRLLPAELPPDLRELTGHESPVRTQVLALPAARALIVHLALAAEGLLGAGAPVEIAIGSTHGRHRAVVLAMEIAARLRLTGHHATACHEHLTSPGLPGRPSEHALEGNRMSTTLDITRPAHARYRGHQQRITLLLAALTGPVSALAEVELLGEITEHARQIATLASGVHAGPDRADRVAADRDGAQVAALIADLAAARAGQRPRTTGLLPRLDQQLANDPECADVLTDLATEKDQPDWLFAERLNYLVDVLTELGVDVQLAARIEHAIGLRADPDIRYTPAPSVSKEGVTCHG
jgi:hypothetical protein